jgi:hypothetical protein
VPRDDDDEPNPPRVTPDEDPAELVVEPIECELVCPPVHDPNPEYHGRT